jgi:hypothetical protein
VGDARPPRRYRGQTMNASDHDGPGAEKALAEAGERG